MRDSPVVKNKLGIRFRIKCQDIVRVLLLWSGLVTIAGETHHIGNSINVIPQTNSNSHHQHSNNQHYLAACGTIASNNHTKIILKNPHHPEPTYVRAICETVIERSNESIRALNISFNQLDLYRSNYDGTCMHDRFGVYTDLNAAITPILCGNQTGKSLTIPFEPPHTSLIVSITTSDLDHDRIWDLRIEQLPNNVVRSMIK